MTLTGRNKEGFLDFFRPIAFFALFTIFETVVTFNPVLAQKSRTVSPEVLKMFPIKSFFEPDNMSRPRRLRGQASTCAFKSWISISIASFKVVERGLTTKYTI
jgi:hypothetical protein